MTFPKKRFCARASGTMVALMAASSTFAQTATREPDANEGGVQDIVVTAQKREQRLQDVPVSVTALTPDTIVANRITNVRDLDAISPNLTVRTVFGGSSLPTYSMRGLVSTGSSVGSDKGVAVYIDGVYLGAASGSIFDLATIERIEVLKGPQGTLFGRNSTGGAISLTTKTPTGEASATQLLSYGNYDQFRSATTLATPRWGPLSAVATYTHAERRGDVRNLGGGTRIDLTKANGGNSAIFTTPRHLGSFNTEAVGVAVNLEASQDLIFTYRFDYTANDYSSNGQALVYAQPAVRLIIAAQPNQSILTPITQSRPDAVNNSNLPNKTRNWGHALTTVYKASDTVSIKNIAAYRKMRFEAAFQDIAGAGGLTNRGGALFAGFLGAPVAAATIGAPLLIQTASTTGQDEQWSEELQVNLDTDFMTLTAGLLYYRQTSVRGPFGEENGLGRLRSGAFRVFPNFEAPFAGQLAGTGGRSTQVKQRSQAAYAQGELHVLRDLDLVGGIRYTDDRKTGLDRSIVSGLVGSTFVIDYQNDQINYTVGVNYKPDRDILLYGKYSTGFISGGSLSGIVYNPETAKSLEAGLKADWFDRVLRTNVALFSVKYGDLQLTTSGTNLTPSRPDLGSALVNVGDARAKGFELETTLAPMRSLQFTANAGYTDFKYTRLLPIVTTGIARFLTIQRPKWTLNFSGQYETEPLFGDTSLIVRLDANWKSKSFGSGSLPLATASFTAAEQAAYLDAITVNPYWIVNGRVALQDLRIGAVNATLALWGRNLFDNKSKSYVTSLVTVISADFERARTYGVDLTVKF